MNRQAILQLLQAQLPELLAVYAFGSRQRGTAQPDSDLDLAVLVAGYADPLDLWETAGKLSEIVGCPVDLLDFRAASTVMQYQILSTGARWWAKDSAAAIYEAAILSEKTELDQGRTAQFTDDFITDKTAIIDRCVRRAREEYNKDTLSFSINLTCQDAAMLNILHAYQATLEIGQHLIRREKLGVPQSSRDVFTLLAQGGLIETTLADKLKRMVGFRNIAVHDDQTLQLPITVSIIETHLDDFLQFTKTLLQHDAALPKK
ncbi:MAG: HepT-like ribonuclease domain-containing protein [Azonexus sp.]|nr:DUF86 domain-containing protein [Azonexus sp.]MDZ4315854.1 HepT-like ribonuclease domain-containing protein [Azonexus sp.]